MSGMLNKLEGMMGMGGNNNNNNNNNTNDNNNNSSMSNNMGSAGTQSGLASTTAGTTTTTTTTDRYEPMIQQGEGYVKQHYSTNANVMRGEQLVEKADAYRLGNAQGNMQGGVGGMMSSDPNVSAQNPQAGNDGAVRNFSKEGGTDSSYDKERPNYGANAGMGPSTMGAPQAGVQEGGVNNQNM